jgi:hypothetical protein
MTHDMREALACPFCGSGNVSDGEILSSDADGGNRATQSECQDCGAVGPKGTLAQDEIDYGSVKAIAAWNRRAALSAAPEADTILTPEKMKRGGRYNWKNQSDRLIYLRKSGNWHQFKKIGDPREVWCEVSDGYLHMLEETEDQQ